MSVDGPPASGSLPQFAQPSLIGEVLDGRYKITKLLGEGGMGQVYAAEHVHIEKRYAIKLLRPEIVSNAEAVSRFRQEARSSSSIGHRNIIAIEDFGALPDGRIYMCMELLNGAALNDMLTQPLSVDRLLNILIQTGHGLAAAHAKNIVHRDMKPENIFVTIGPNNEDIPKILDFGIAKVAGNDGSNHLTRTGTIFGTPFYMAPEQALGNAVDQRTDIYAMGVIAYEVFSGSLPFQGESFMGILTQHITTEPEPVAQRAAKAGRQLPLGLAELIMRCLRKNPAERPQTMDELVNALIQIYRTVAGAGMSSYMEAFPVSGGHNLPTPGPMMGPGAGPGAPITQTPAAGMYAPPNPMSGQHPGVMAPGPSGSSPAVSAASSGMYDPSASVVAPKKSKAGLFIAIFVVLLLGGGAAAFVIYNNSQSEGGGSGAGSQVASTGSAKGSATAGSATAGSATAGSATAGSATAGSATAGSNQVASSGSNNAKDPWSEHGSAAGSDVHGDGSGAGSALVPAGSNSGDHGGSATITPPPEPTMDVFVETKPYIEKIEIWEDGQKVDDDSPISIVAKSKHSYVLKAKGFKDKPFTVDGTAKKVVVAMERVPVPHTNPNVNPNPNTNPLPPPPKQDCGAKLLNPKDQRCREQFCKTHPDFPACGLE